MVTAGHWEYVTRITANSAVGIVAIAPSGGVVLVEQHRPPVGRSVIELPAGLVGDLPGEEDEGILKAAQRELLEETGYVAARWTELGRGYSSPGLTDELIVLLLAEDLTREGPGGGDGSETITCTKSGHRNHGWLRERDAVADLKLFAGLQLAAEARRLS